MAVGSFTVPVSAGVLSFVNTSSSATTGAVMSAETVPVPAMKCCLQGQSLLQSLYRHPPLPGLVLTSYHLCLLPLLQWCHQDKSQSRLNRLCLTAYWVCCIDRIKHRCIWCNRINGHHCSIVTYVTCCICCSHGNGVWTVCECWKCIVCKRPVPSPLFTAG